MAVTRGGGGLAAQGRSKGKASAQGRKSLNIAGSRRKRSNPEQGRGGGDDSPSLSRSTPERGAAGIRVGEQGIGGPSRKRVNSDREERGASDVPSTSTPEKDIIPVCRLPLNLIRSI